MRKTSALVLAAVLLLDVPATARPRPPYDFTGRWAGVIMARGETFEATADLQSTRPDRFAGRAIVAGKIGSTPCGLHGRRARRIQIVLRCDDGTRGKLLGTLDTMRDTIAGAARLRDRRGGRARGPFTLGKQRAAGS